MHFKRIQVDLKSTQLMYTMYLLYSKQIKTSGSDWTSHDQIYCINYAKEIKIDIVLVSVSEVETCYISYKTNLVWMQTMNNIELHKDQFADQSMPKEGISG